MKIVKNERLKLTATFLNGLAIAMFAVGGLAPVTQAMRSMSLLPGEWWRTALVGCVCIVFAGVLHWTARAVLGGLTE